MIKELNMNRLINPVISAPLMFDNGINIMRSFAAKYIPNDDDDDDDDDGDDDDGDDDD